MITDLNLVFKLPGRLTILLQISHRIMERNTMFL